MFKMSGYCLPSSLLELSVQSLVREEGTTTSTSTTTCQNMACLPTHLKDCLRDILLKRRTLTASELACLIHPKMQYIDLSDQVLTGDHLQVLLECKDLRKLDLNQAAKAEPVAEDLSASLGQLLGQLHQLTSLHLRDLASVTAGVVSVLAGSCQQLRHLELAGCSAVGDEAVAHLRNLASLESLSLARTSVSDVALASLARSECRSCLQELRVNSCPAITDIGIQALLEGLSGLQILIFHGCPKVTDGARVSLEQYFAAHGRTVRQVTWTVY